MKKQNYEIKTEKIRSAFLELKKKHPEKLKTRLNLSWSNWGFGIESLADSAARLEKNGVQFIELHGNHYGPDLGYKVAETKKVLGDLRMIFEETEAAMAALPNRAGELGRAATLLGEQHINIDYSYCGVEPGSPRAIVVFGVDNINKAAALLDSLAARES